MLRLLRTQSDDRDFVELVRRLDADLAERDGDAHPFYAQFNKIDKIKFVDVHLSRKPGKGYRRESVGLVGALGAGIILPEVHSGNREKTAGAVRLYQRSGYQIIPNYGQYAGVENSVCFEKELTRKIQA